MISECRQNHKLSIMENKSHKNASGTVVVETNERVLKPFSWLSFIHIHACSKGNSCLQSFELISYYFDLMVRKCSFRHKPYEDFDFPVLPCSTVCLVML